MRSWSTPLAVSDPDGSLETEWLGQYLEIESRPTAYLQLMGRSRSSPTYPKDIHARDQRTATAMQSFTFPRSVSMVRRKVVKRFHYVRSFSRSKSKTSAATIAKRKRAKYPHVPPPPTLAHQLAIMQFADGGKMDSHIKSFMEAQAKAAGGSRGTMNIGVADVYRDSNGGIWWDADEEVEYAHLLDGVDIVKAEEDAEEGLWEDFDGPHHTELGIRTRVKNAVDHVRCPSLGSETVSSVDSDFDPKFLLPTPEADTCPTFTHGTPNDLALASLRLGGKEMSSLSHPPQPSRQAPHLSKTVSLGDLQAFGRARPTYHRVAVPSLAQITPDNFVSRAGNRGYPKGTASRRRPPPLKISSSHIIQKRSDSVKALHLDIATLRKEFLDDSFTPSTPFDTSSSITSSSCNTTSSRSGTPRKRVKKSSMLGIRTWFGMKSS